MATNVTAYRIVLSISHINLNFWQKLRLFRPSVMLVFQIIVIIGSRNMVNNIIDIVIALCQQNTEIILALNWKFRNSNHTDEPYL